MSTRTPVPPAEGSALTRAMAVAAAALAPGGPPPGSRVWTLERPGRPRSLNAERSGTLWQHRKATTEERDEWGMMALTGPRFSDPVVVAARPWMTGTLQDPGNCYPSVKAAIDGLRDAGRLYDDTAEQIHAIVVLPPLRGPARLVLAVVPVCLLAPQCPTRPSPEDH